MIDLQHLSDFLEVETGIKTDIADRLFTQGFTYKTKEPMLEVCYGRIMPAHESEIFGSSASQIANQAFMTVDIVYSAPIDLGGNFDYHITLQKLWKILHAYEPVQYVMTDQNYRSFTAVTADFITDNGRIITKLMYGFTFDDLLNFN